MLQGVLPLGSRTANRRGRPGTGTHRALLLRLRASLCIAMGPCPQFRTEPDLGTGTHPDAAGLDSSEIEGPDGCQSPFPQPRCARCAIRLLSTTELQAVASGCTCGRALRQTRVARAPEPVGLSQNLTNLTHVQNLKNLKNLTFPTAVDWLIW